MKKLFMATALALVAVGAQAQQVRDLSPTAVTETTPERALISKPGWLRGLHVIGDELPGNARPRIEAFVPSGWVGGKLCARLTSIVGTYDAGHEYEIPPGWTAQRANLLYAGKQPDLVAAITPETGGVAVEKGPCTGDEAGREQEFAANFWNHRSELILNEDGLGELRLNMNIARADELLPGATLTKSGEALDVRCAPIDSPDAIAFNYRCSILLSPGQIVAAGSDTIRFSFTRLYRGRESAERTAQIYVGAGQ